MGSSVTYCTVCGACNWAGKECCADCGGELEPTLHQIHAYLYNTDSEFRKMVDERRDRESQKSTNP